MGGGGNIVARFDLRDGNAPRLLVFDAVFPPRARGLKLLNADWRGLVVGLRAGRIGVLVVPDLRRGLAFGEEQQVGTCLLYTSRCV